MTLAHRAANFTRAYPVLYVDDEPDNLLVFQATFRDEFEVLTAGSTDEALELVGVVPIAVLLADQRMPGRSGVELCELLRASHPTIVRMLITAYSDTEVAIAAINRGGVSRYITKPWQAEDVRQILREAIARAHLERMVANLRGSILDKERLVGSQAVTMRLLHDVAQTNASIEGCCHNLELLSERLHESVDQATFATYLDEVSDLRNFVDFLADLRTRGAAGIHGDGNRMRRQDVGVAELLRVVVELARREQTGIAGVRAHCEAGTTAWTDRTDLSRILLNLTRSAGRALQESGRVDGRIIIEARTEGGTTAIVVSDNRPDGPAAALTTDDDDAQRGFELVVARELALTHGGTLELVGGGRAGWTAWQVSLPAQAARDA